MVFDGFIKLGMKEKIKPGQRICITSGSRGISNIVLITKEIVNQVKALGAEPFIIPAMGSHGGASAEGQISILENCGITEKTMGCPILSSMKTVKISNVDGYNCRSGSITGNNRLRRWMQNDREI